MIVLAAFFRPSLLSIVLVLSCFFLGSHGKNCPIQGAGLETAAVHPGRRVERAHLAFYLIRRHFLPEVFPPCRREHDPAHRPSHCGRGRALLFRTG